MSDEIAKYCTNCEKKVFPIRTFSAGVVIGILLLGVVPGILYYYFKERKCPHCKNSDWDVEKS